MQNPCNVSLTCTQCGSRLQEAFDRLGAFECPTCGATVSLASAVGAIMDVLDVLRDQHRSVVGCHVLDLTMREGE